MSLENYADFDTFLRRKCTLVRDSAVDFDNMAQCAYGNSAPVSERKKTFSE